MSSWAGLAPEDEGVRKAVRNLNGDHLKIARYVYNRSAAYVGWDHEAVTVHLIAAAMEGLAALTGASDE